MPLGWPCSSWARRRLQVPASIRTHRDGGCIRGCERQPTVGMLSNLCIAVTSSSFSQLWFMCLTKMWAGSSAIFCRMFFCNPTFKSYHMPLIMIERLYCISPFASVKLKQNRNSTLAVHSPIANMFIFFSFILICSAWFQHEDSGVL